MFRRAIFQQTRQLSTRNLAVATQTMSVPLAVRRFAAVTNNARLWRAYSNAAATEETARDKSTAGKGEKKDKRAKEKDELTKVTQELEAKTQEARDYKDKFTRAVADFRNLQDRTERDMKTARDFAIQKFAKDLVDSVDNLDRALQVVPEKAKSDPENNKDLLDFYNGLKITENILLSTLKKHGLEKVDPLGEVFDPNKHEATFQVPMPDKEPNTVFDVQQTGFVLNGRTIRAAKVGVVAHPEN